MRPICVYKVTHWTESEDGKHRSSWKEDVFFVSREELTQYLVRMEPLQEPHQQLTIHALTVCSDGIAEAQLYKDKLLRSLTAQRNALSH